jgi:hypothetical protein
MQVGLAPHGPSGQKLPVLAPSAMDDDDLRRHGRTPAQACAASSLLAQALAVTRLVTGCAAIISVIYAGRALAGEHNTF